MADCLHTVQYYETDKMGLTHHSNYVRWMEEARVAFLRDVGWPYEKLEALGVFSPVTALECRFRAPTTFADAVQIAVSPESFDGLRLRFRYEMRSGGRLVFEGRSEHCFLDGCGRILRLKREQPALYELLTSLTAG